MSDSSTSNWGAWSIPNMSSSHAHSTGYWGPVEANHAFCEPHYAISPYIAECFNSLSSVIYILVALSTTFPKDSLLQTAQGWLFLVGIGSMLFHGTMRYIFQLTDEIPMVGFMATLMMAKISASFQQQEKNSKSAMMLFMAKAMVVVYSVGLMLIYVVLDEYEIFIHGFTVLVLVDTLLTLSLLDKTGKSKWTRIELWAYVISFVAIILGRVAWETEHLLCPHYPHVWPLHVVWHLFSCLSAYAAMVTVYVIRAKTNGDIQRLPRFVGFQNLVDDASEEKSD